LKVPLLKPVMFQKLKIITAIASLVISVQWVRIQLPLISKILSDSLYNQGGLNIELFIVKKTQKGSECNEITPLTDADISNSLYQIFTDPNTRLVVSLNKRGCIEEYI